jgi:GNAT superfamily N-acetyltransferase
VNLRFPRFDGTRIDRILQLMAQLYLHETIPFDTVRTRRVIHELLANPQWGAIWWIEAGGELAGYFVLTLGYSLEFGGRFALLDEFLIEQPWQGQGFGTRALTFMEEWCREQHIPALRLEVGYENPRALALYRRAGFQDLNRSFLTRVLEA